MSEHHLLRGTAILTTAIFISKILGIIYIFPFQAMVGLEGLALYHYGYTPYTVFISLSTLGIPIAISKFISKYHALGDRHTVQRLFRSGLVVMSMTGLVAFATLFFLAEPIALQVLDPDNLDGNSIDDAVFTIRMVSTALIVIPLLSTIRGYFQGFGMMGPTAVSQVVEQIVRIIFILVLTYLILEIWGGGLGAAVGFATFGAFVGALGGLAVLIIFLVKRKKVLATQALSDQANGERDHAMSLPRMYKELLSYALPISFVGLAIPLYQTVDLMTFNQALMQIGYSQREAEMFFGAFGQAAHKLVLIPVSIATAMSITIIPAVTSAFVSQDHDKLQKQMTQVYQTILFFTLPASVGLVLLADAAYGTLYSLEDIEIGGHMLTYYAPIAVLFSVFAVSTSILQGINQQKFAVIALMSGIALKAICNYPFILWFDAKGAILATGAGYMLAISICLWAIGRYAAFDFRAVGKPLSCIAGYTALMGVLVWLMNSGLAHVFPLETKLNALIILSVTVITGVVVYLFISIRTGFAEKILGRPLPVIGKYLQRKRDRNELNG